MMLREFDGFTIDIFIDEGNEWLAHFVELPQVSAFGAKPEKALKELKIAWEGVKESYCKHHQPVPLAPRLHNHFFRGSLS